MVEINFSGDIYALSDIGKKRKNNEDAAYCAKSPYGILLALCDGMGGHRKGEVASKMVIDALAYAFTSNRTVFNLRRAKRFLLNNSKAVNKEIYNLSVSNEDYKEMGTTECAALVTKDGTKVISIGDSRVYSYSYSSSLTQVSKDQSYVELLFETGRIKKSDMANHPQKNLLTNAVGLNPNLINVEEFNLSNDSYDILLLCSDGLFNMVSDKEIEGVLSDKSLNVEQKARNLINLALEHGGNDNIAVSILEK